MTLCPLSTIELPGRRTAFHDECVAYWYVGRSDCVTRIEASIRTSWALRCQLGHGGHDGFDCHGEDERASGVDNAGDRESTWLMTLDGGRGGHGGVAYCGDGSTNAGAEDHVRFLPLPRCA
jgi:hypothetical protein